MRFMPRMLAFLFGIVGVFSAFVGCWGFAAACSISLVYFGIEAICEAIEHRAGE